MEVLVGGKVSMLSAHQGTFVVRKHNNLSMSQNNGARKRWINIFKFHRIFYRNFNRLQPDYFEVLAIRHGSKTIRLLSNLVASQKGHSAVLLI